MLFASVIFIFFFLPIFLGLQSLHSGNRYRNGLLLAASIFFYFWGEKWQIAILLISISVNYGIALWIDGSSLKASRKRRLACGVILNLAFLLWFKYSAFFIQSFDQFLNLFEIHWNLKGGSQRIPLGISFITFHGLSYLIDTYRGVVHSEKSFKKVALYFFLFPHQIAGPIVRYDLFQSQVDENRKTRPDEFLMGIDRFIRGLAKKVLIANTAARGADGIFVLGATDLSTPLAWLGALCYTVQIYYDFSGYSDMAIGLARMVGFRFHENFDYPYRALSITEFWRRWHISLSTWFRDYLYIPLGGNRVSSARTYFNLTLVFALCGFWHGADWTFLVWGLWHGAFLVIERAGMHKLLKRSMPLAWLWTLTVVVVGWVFFRANGLSHAKLMIERMFSFQAEIGASALYFDRYFDQATCMALLAGLALSTGHFTRWLRTLLLEHRGRAWMYVSFLTVLFLLSLGRLANGTFNPFIYFRF